MHHSTIFKCILKVAFFEGIQHRLPFCLDHLHCDKMGPFSFIFNQGNRKEGWVGMTVMVLLVKNSLVEKEVAAMQKPVLFSPTFREKSSHIFTHLP
jgi:hypothetical protein